MTTCTFHPPSLQGWIYAILVHGSLLVGVGVPLGILMYKYNVLSSIRRSRQQQRRREFGGLMVAILSAGAVHRGTAHITTTYPELVHWIGLFLASTFGFTIFFKSVAVAYEQYPNEADTNLYTFLLWFLCMPEPIFVKGKLKQSTYREIMERIGLFLVKVFGLFMLLSILLNGDLICSKVLQIPSDHVSRLPNYWISTMIRGYLHIWFIYLFPALCLDFSTLAVGVPASVIGGGWCCSFDPGYQNPLWQSRSMKEMWSKRWDIPVQRFLQRSAYTPARKAGWTRSVAVMYTFFISGLLHEYNFSMHNASSYTRPGSAVLFFLLMGLAVIIEDGVTSNPDVWGCPIVIRQFLVALPAPVISTSIAMIVAFIFEPLFVRSWLEAGAIEAATELLPHLSCQ